VFRRIALPEQSDHLLFLAGIQSRRDSSIKALGSLSAVPPPWAPQNKEEGGRGEGGGGRGGPGGEGDICHRRGGEGEGGNKGLLLFRAEVGDHFRK
jgi:hypothetical protein